MNRATSPCSPDRPAPTAAGMTRRAALGLAAAAGVVALTGCSNDANNGGAASSAADAGASSAPASGAKELTVFVVSSLATLDPQNDANSDDQDITGLLGEGLYRLDSDGTTAVPAIAESREVSDDGLTYTFKLKSGVKWQDGQDVTAEQFVEGLRRFYDPATASENANTYFSYVEGSADVYNGEKDPSTLSVSAPDDTTLELTVATVLPEPTVLAFLSSAPAYPIRTDKIEEGGDGWSTNPETHQSCGPYKLEQYAPDEKVVLTRNDAYTGDAPAEADTITFRLFADSSAADVAMGNGELAFYKYASDALIAQMDGKAQVNVSETFGTAVLYMNNGAAPLDDPKVREAVFRAIDPTYANETLESGRATVAKGLAGDVFSDPTGVSFRENSQIIDDFSDDELQKAKDLLKEAGYENGEGLPSMAFITTSTTMGTKRAEFFQAMLKDNLGIQVDVEAYDIPTYLDKLTSGQFAFAFANTSVSCDNVIELFQNFEGSSNNYGIKVDDFDDLLARASTESDPQTQADLLHDAEKALVSEAFAIRPVTYSYQVSLVSNDVENLVMCGTGNVLFNFMTLKSWA